MDKIKPIVLTFSGTDPTGGAGMQADILALSQLGCYPISVVTSITCQDTHGVSRVSPVDVSLIRDQIDNIISDVSVDVIKIGMIPSLKVLTELHRVMLSLPHIPVILDPIMLSGRGDSFNSEEVRGRLVKDIIPLTALITPNDFELESIFHALDGVESSNLRDDLGTKIGMIGASHVLVTGTHNSTKNVVNQLYDATGMIRSWDWPRLDGEYHGSGCTLASASAAYIALSFPIEEAVSKAQQYTWSTLDHGYRIGSGQLIPNRLQTTPEY